MNNRNLIVALAVVALLTVAATTAGCATNTNPSPTPIPATTTSSGNNTTFSSGAGFNITYPKSLKIDQSTDAKSPVRVYIYLNPNETADGVLVATKGLAGGQTLNDFVAENVKELNNYSSTGFYKNFKILNETNSTFGGKPAHTIVWNGTIPVQYNKTTSVNESVKEMQTFVVNNNMGYVITYKTISSDFDKYLAQAQRIMSSFVLT
jgi:PsbP-like protein